MKLSDFDLQQLNETRLLNLPAQQKDALLVKLLEDLKEARDRLKANSKTSSRPPSSDPPWSNAGQAAESSTSGSKSGVAEDSPESEDEEVKSDEDEPRAEDSKPDASQSSSAELEPKSRKKPGRQKGMKGYGRPLKLAVSATVVHPPDDCVVCGCPLNPEQFTATTGHYVLDLKRESEGGLEHLRVTHEKHLYGEIRCECGHCNRSEAARSEADPCWEQVELSEWRLVGPTLASLIVCLSHRLHLSRARIQEFLHDWLGIELSTSTINHCIHEAGRAVEPIEDQLVEELQQAALAYADETPWKEWGQLLWLWVITTPTICLYFIGYRSKEILSNVFSEDFVGWLMSDGYTVYREFQHRLRCWAHLIRKARGLKESLSEPAQCFGHDTVELLDELIGAIYQAREGPPVNLKTQFEPRLEAFRTRCEQYRDNAHEKTRALAREFLNDWEAIWIVLEHPYLPITNNEAERMLRHWVIARRISQGTRTEQGSRAFALLASVIETCRKRGILPWPYLAQVIAERRKGNPAPKLPAAIA
jgi:transposase